MYIICSKLRRKKSLSQSALVVCLAIMLYQIQVLQAKGARNEPAQFTPTESDYHLVAHECKRRLVDTKNGYTIVFKEDKIFGQRNSEHEHSVIELTAVGPNKVIMRGSKSKRYLCLDRKNNWITQIKLDLSRCTLNEEIGNRGYNFYYRYKSKRVNRRTRKLKKRLYLALNNRGQISKKARKDDTCAMMLRIVSDSDTPCTEERLNHAKAFPSKHAHILKKIHRLRNKN